MNKLYLLLGSNLSDRVLMIEKAREKINAFIGEIIKKSGVYESAPWGFEASISFLNQIVLVESELYPLEILKRIKQIENQLGRIRTSDNYESRTIDIDILFYNNEIIVMPELTIPHPQLHKRRFTLVPLNEIANDFVHPGLRISIQDLLSNCDDKSEVKIYS